MGLDQRKYSRSGCIALKTEASGRDRMSRQVQARMAINGLVYCSSTLKTLASVRYIGNKRNMIRISQIKIEIDVNKIRSEAGLQDVLMRKVSRILRISLDEIEKISIAKHGIDARKKPVLFDVYSVDVYLRKGNEGAVLKRCKDRNVSVVSEKKYDFLEKVILRIDKEESRCFAAGQNDTEKAFKSKEEPKVRKDAKEAALKKIAKASANKKIVIVGFGPAGMFCGYELAKAGFKPVILERGSDVDTRLQAVTRFWETGRLDASTNVQFGEGGAGTFSDGKLNTVVKDKEGRGEEALDIFVRSGVPERIKYESKPHIGTDILMDVVRNMRKSIQDLGGEVIFNSKADDILIDESGQVKGVQCGDRVIECCFLILAIGHSARDTFRMLLDKKVEMVPKPFAVGFRVEHPQSLINQSQYGIADSKALPAAPYKLTATTSAGRGVYSFCMCPGGFVVNASSEEGMLAVNGMSYSKRDGRNANSAIIITVDPRDFGGEGVLSGVDFQRRLEKKAYELAQGKIPVEYYGDFKRAVEGKDPDAEALPLVAGSKDPDAEVLQLTEADRPADGNLSALKDCSTIPKDFLPQMKGHYKFCDVHGILPDDLNKAFVEGMESFGRIIKGYDDDKVLVSGVESRTSSPVRIVRKDDGQSVNVRGLYPCGEGAGYAGGIMSAAMDGIRTAELVAGAILAST